MIGSSFTQGKEVKAGERYTDLLNKRLVVNDEELAVYNCSKDGNYFPDIVNDFYAITQEFSDAGVIVIEIGSTSFSSEDLLAACVQHEFDEKQKGSNIMSTLSNTQKAS